ncbi:hypothetical protein RHSIM_Rhsim07G0133800 [Rhododendron simsii]|uniref:AIR9-like A9 domain-containing protein n=1 Tax=Rhododendron simsii TaxID=118357 RepID=A0A834LIX6_RHOSS|nr:hypothetical protein RHSIM_Rhsim07G0133800 [Rhododendron simsii]
MGYTLLQFMILFLMEYSYFIPKAGNELCDAKDAEVSRRALENQIAELVSQTNIEEQECLVELNACNQEKELQILLPSQRPQERILKGQCTPVLDGTEYPTIFAISSRVSPGTGWPKVLKIDVRGELMEGNTIRGYAEVACCGGTPGKGVASWQWRRWNSSSVVIVGAEDEQYQLTLDDIDSCLVLMYTPATKEAHPSVNDVQIIGEVVEGGTIKGVGKYFGGRAGLSKFEWLGREDRNKKEFVLVSTSTGQEGESASTILQIAKQGDGIGLTYISPSVDPSLLLKPLALVFHFCSTTVEGSTLTVDKKYWGGKEGNSVFRWFRVSPFESIFSHLSPVKDATTASYILSVDDIGFFVSVSCEPVRSDWARGPIVLSEQIRPIIIGPPTCQSLKFLGSFVEKGDCFSEWFRLESNGIKDKLNAGKFLDLSLEDVGRCLELVHTPVCKDGVKGSATCALSTAVSPGFVVIAEPMGVELVIPGCCEDQIVIPQKTCFGGQEGDREYVWYRTENKLNEVDLMDITDMCEDVHVCGQRL